MLYLSAGISSFDPDSALKITNSAIALAQEKLLAKELASCYNQLGNLYSSRGDFFRALELYEKALNIREKLKRPKDIAISYYTLGSIYVKLSDYKKGIDYCYKSLKIIEELNNGEIIFSIKGVIADAFRRMRKLDEALNILNENLKYAQKSNNILHQARVYGSIGLIYDEKKDTLNAFKYYRLQLAAARKINNKAIEGTCLVNMGTMYHGLGNFDKAIDYLQQGLEIERKLNGKLGVAVILANLGSINLDKNNLTVAEQYAREGLELARETGALDTESTIMEILCEIYRKQGKFQKALDYYMELSAIKDTIMNEEIENEVTRKVLKYEFEKKSLADSLTLAQVKKISEAELATKESELKREQLLRYFILILFLLVAITGFLLFRQNKLKTEQKTMQLEQKLLRSQMNPHFIFNCLQAIQNFTLKNNGKEATRYLSLFGTLTRSVLQNSRVEQISLQSEITLLEHYLELQKLLTGDRFEYTITVLPKVDTLNTSIPPMLAQPFIENAIEHGMRQISSGGKIDITFAEKNDELIFEISDNGRGITENDKNNHHSLATTITKERIELINKKKKRKASFTLKEAYPDSVNKGVKVRFAIPLS